MSERGRFITLEGVDGAGKSTHLDWIAGRLRAAGRAVLVTREPGGTPLAEQLRHLVLGEPMDPVTETLIMFAARSDHVARQIRPALESGKWVLCDRFTDATAAYQAAGKGIPIDLVEQLAAATHPGLSPDRTLVFDCPFEVSQARLHGSGRPLDRFERQDRSFFERVRESYLLRARSEPGRVRLIDAAASLEEVKKSIEKNLVMD